LNLRSIDEDEYHKRIKLEDTLGMQRIEDVGYHTIVKVLGDVVYVTTTLSTTHNYYFWNFELDNVVIGYVMAMIKKTGEPIFLKRDWVMTMSNCQPHHIEYMVELFERIENEDTTD